MSKLTRLSLSIEESLLESLNDLMQKSSYENRSEFIRDLIREHILRQQWEHDGEVIATLTLAYDHHQRGLTEKLISLQHHCEGQVLASTHVHLNHKLCAEMIMVKGTAREIKKLANEMKKMRGVLHAEMSPAMPVEEGKTANH